MRSTEGVVESDTRSTKALDTDSSKMAATPISFESFAPRSESQRSRLSRIAVLTGGPMNMGVDSSSSDGSNVTKKTSLLVSAMSGPSHGAVDDLVLCTGDDDDDNNDPSSSSSPVLDDTLALASATCHHLSSCLTQSGVVQARLRTSLQLCTGLTTRHSELLRQSGELSAAADRLQTEEQVLANHARQIGDPLRHFDALDNIGVQVGVLFKDQANVVVRGLAKVKVDTPQYVTTLEQIDEALSFFTGHYQRLRQLDAAAEANLTREERRERRRNGSSGGHTPVSSSGCVVEYYKRARALLDAALFLIREAVVDRVKQATQDVTEALNLTRVPVPADKLEASLVYTRFHGISSRSNALIRLLRQRSTDDPDNDDPYLTLLRLCETTYAKSRETLLKTTVKVHMDRLKQQHGLINMTRLSSVFLIRLCTVETSLYLDFFAGEDTVPKKDEEQDKDNSNNSNNTEQADDDDDDTPTLHPHQQSKQRRASITALRNTARLATDDAAFQRTLATLCTMLHRTVRRGLITVSDLDTLCQIVSVLREEWSSANSSPHTLAVARSLSGVVQDAQERLIFCANQALQKEVVRYKPTEEELDYPKRLLGRSGDDTTDTGADAVQAQLRVYEAWYPPMRSVLRVLSKIFRVVEPRVFEDLAQQSVHACTKSLKEAAAHLILKEGVLHADLFLVKHLLVLREQSSPFDGNLRAVERQLDFSDTGRAVTRFLANRNRKLFSMTTENALVTLLREGVSVQESSVDSKRDLEDSLRSACNDFIEHTSERLAGPLLTVVERCKGSNDDGVVVAAPIVRDAVADTVTRIDTRSDDLHRQMSVYLDNAATQGILLRPVARKIMRALEDCKRYTAEVSASAGSDDNDDSGWKDEEMRTQIQGLTADVEHRLKTNMTVR